MTIYFQFFLGFFICTLVFFMFCAIDYSVYREYPGRMKEQSQRRLRLATALVPLSIFWPVLAVGIVGYGLYILGKSIKTLGGWLVE